MKEREIKKAQITGRILEAAAKMDLYHEVLGKLSVKNEPIYFKSKSGEVKRLISGFVALEAAAEDLNCSLDSNGNEDYFKKQHVVDMENILTIINMH